MHWKACAFILLLMGCWPVTAQDAAPGSRSVEMTAPPSLPSPAPRQAEVQPGAAPAAPVLAPPPFAASAPLAIGNPLPPVLMIGPVSDLRFKSQTASLGLVDFIPILGPLIFGTLALAGVRWGLKLGAKKTEKQITAASLRSYAAWYCKGFHY